MADAFELVHGTAVALEASAVLFRGAPGAGKSDLALRCVGLGPGGLTAEPFKLIADDQVVAVAAGGRVMVSAPPAIHGLLEVRGVGILTVPAAAEAELVLTIDLLTGRAPDRMPAALTPALVAGIRLPRIELDPREPSAPLKVALALMNTLKAKP